MENSRPEERLEKLDLELPHPGEPVANYVAWKRAGDLIFVSGQLPTAGGEVAFHGPVGRDLSIEDAQMAARLCAINVLAVLKAAAGELSNVEAVRIEGFVASGEGFQMQSQVVNGASDLLVKVLGEAGKHTRFAVGVSELPMGAAVEISAVFLLKTKPEGEDPE